MSMNFQIIYHNKQYLLAVLHVSDFLDNKYCYKTEEHERGTIKQFKVKGLSSCFVLNLRMSGENCLSSRAAPGISFFRVPTKDDEYSINWRNNIVAVITRDTIRC